MRASKGNAAKLAPRAPSKQGGLQADKGSGLKKFRDPQLNLG